MGAHPYLDLYSLKLDTSLFALLQVALVVTGALRSQTLRSSLIVAAISTLQRNALLPMV